MKKGDIIITSRENAGTIAYNVHEKRWCVHFPNDENFNGQNDVDETAMKIALTKEEIEYLARNYYKDNKEAYEFVNFHIGQDEIEGSFKTGIIKGIEIGYRLANSVRDAIRNDDCAFSKNED